MFPEKSLTGLGDDVKDQYCSKKKCPHVSLIDTTLFLHTFMSGCAWFLL